MAKIISSTAYIAPTSDNDLATKKYVDDNAGPGGSSPTKAVLLLWTTNSAPTGYLICNGAEISRTTYSSLFSVIGTTYGLGAGPTTFNIPDLRQRFPLGKAVSGTRSTLDGTGGSIDHRHNIPAHYHGLGAGSTLTVPSSGSTTGTQSANHT